MNARALKFLLVPDSSAARRARRLIAERGACSGVVVGSWPDLVAWAERAYLLSLSVDDSQQTFRRALAELDGAFWFESLSVAPIETSEAVESALVQILSAFDSTDPLDAEQLEDLTERARGHLADLLRLAEALAERLPDDLSTIRNLLAAEPGQALHPIRVFHVEGVPSLTRWQAALIAKLNRDAATDNNDDTLDEALENILRQALCDDAPSERPDALSVLQSRLFSTTDGKAELDNSLQWVGVRDFLQEAEVAAGMVQRLLAGHPELEAADIGLLVPDSFEYAVAVEDAFRLGGLALSGLLAERWRRDLGAEAVFHFLYCRQKPAPAMALAVCLSSPLMPWSREQGAVLAQAVMDGNYRLQPRRSASGNARAMLELLRGSDSKPETLAQALKQFVALLDGADEFAAHIHQAKATAEQVCIALEEVTDIEWAQLRRAISPRFITLGKSTDFNLEGVTVWRESHEPWRAVRHLIVLGFAQGRYPVALKASPVFSADDLLAMRERLGLTVPTPSEELALRRLRFKRQLSAVSEAVTFLIPRRDPSGVAQAPAESLVFMRRLFGGSASSDELIIELDAADDRARVRHLALAAPEPPRPPRVIRPEDIDFDRDLLALRNDKQGRLKPESPSSLETLMVSRLAWLLRRLKAEPIRWAPETADVALLGTLAHDVFEGLFRPGESHPVRNQIPRRVHGLLAGAIRRLAPFLQASQWQVERRHLAAGIIKAAQAWRDVLERLDAQVLASEVWLQGTWSGIPVHGQADLILGLPGDRLLVVDYKRSRSRSRRPRMEKGYDSQANLYRAMLRSGGPKNTNHEALLTRLRSASRTGIVYYMLNDQVSLSDVMLLEAGAVPGWQALENDVAGQAMALIERRLAEVHEGHLCLNREGDAAFFERQAGVTPYALANSPLIALFTLPGEAVEAE